MLQGIRMTAFFTVPGMTARFLQVIRFLSIVSDSATVMRCFILCGILPTIFRII